MSAASKPRPSLDGPERPFWEGLRDGRILVQRCLSCGLHRFPASKACPACHGTDFEWSAVDGRGEVVSFCVFHKCYFPGFADEMPYAVVQVRLAGSGVQFFSNVVGVPPGAIAVGMPVVAVFERVDEALTLLKFRPAAGEAAR